MWETWVWSSGEGNSNPLQHSCLENPMDGGAWWATVHGVAKSWTWLSDFTFTFTMWQVGRSLLLQPGEPCPALLHPKLASDSPPPLGQAVGVSGSPGQRATTWPLISPLFSWVAKVPEIINSIQQAHQEELHCQTEFNDTFPRSSRCCFAATWWWRSGSLRQPWSTSAWRASVTSGGFSSRISSSLRCSHWGMLSGSLAGAQVLLKALAATPWPSERSFRMQSCRV